MRAFRIELDVDSSISLSTSTLDICDGRDIIIDPTAYPVMWTVLDEIHVFVAVKDPVVGDDRGGMEFESCSVVLTDRDCFFPFRRNTAPRKRCSY